MKQCHYCERIDELNELKGGHDKFSWLKIICIAMFFVEIFFFDIVVVKEAKS